MMMRNLCPNSDKEGGLDTVLEVPIPEEMFEKMGGSTADVRWQNMRDLMRAHYQSAADKWAAIANPLLSDTDHFMLLLKLVSSAFIPFRVQLDHALTTPIKDGSIESCTAKYIVQQYLAAAGGVTALNGVSSMYAVGQVKMVVAASDTDKAMENARLNSEAGGFVIWQMNPELWYLELVVARHKISAGSDGKINWNHSNAPNCNISRGPPRPLRRFFQGLDPRSTANLFSNTVCIGEKIINDEDCFILKLETSSDVLKAQSTPHTELVHHTIWGYFSQRSGLLIQFEDTKLIRMKPAAPSASAAGDDCVFYETSLQSFLEDYRHVDGINIAHSGKTTASIYRYGKTHKKRWKLEETWSIEEIDFNISGLSVDYFLPPADDDDHHKDSDEHNCENGISC
ncbi:uncharacterized protein LOC125218136 [Salvia hispanica]|uniref:uncharacterized protein LOC125218136 n=1 Tax=Salvia hispanica TaxID=49212 RepID=UPI0020097ABB|nr:uncharacterized protein LOC125218136 [Salvia hispanica]